MKKNFSLDCFSTSCYSPSATPSLSSSSSYLICINEAAEKFYNGYLFDSLIEGAQERKKGVLWSEDATRLFYSSSEKNTVTWNAMLGGLLQRNLAEEVWELFFEMKGLNVGPDEVSYVAIDGAYARTKNVKLGRQLHSLAVKINMESGVFLGNALIGMYAKCGDITNAKRLRYTLSGLFDEQGRAKKERERSFILIGLGCP